MILRKPYAFLIKHFKLIHLVITGILFYLVLKYRDVYVFLRKCVTDNAYKYNALEYIDYTIYIFILIAILLLGGIYFLLKYKDKPRRQYIFSIGVYIIISIVMLATYGYLRDIVNNLIEQKTIRFYRDITFISILFQYYIIVVMLIRGLGFDIKKFNFGKDVQELNLTDEDGEEIEVNVGIDTTNIVRGIRKKKRELGYFYREYTKYILAIIFIILIILGVKGYNYFNREFKVYNQGDTVGIHDFIKITDSYYDKSDNGNYIIVKFDVYRNGVRQRFDVGKVSLYVNKKKYNADKNVCYKYDVVGNCYKKQYILEKEKSYILVYPVDKIDTKNSYIIYNEDYDNNYKIKLSISEY